jgi:hypothetical protein
MLEKTPKRVISKKTVRSAQPQADALRSATMLQLSHADFRNKLIHVAKTRLAEAASLLLRETTSIISSD